MPMGCYNKRPEEMSDDFFVRIGNAVLARELTWDGAAKVLNGEFGKNFGECAYRKRFKAFRAGMQYQESLSNRDVGTCILSISDLHIPFQKPIETFSEYAGKIDILQVNGDLVDCSSISRFLKVYRKSPMEEILIARQYMIDLIEMLQPKKVVINYGNHDLRFQNYLAKNLDTDLLELMPKTSLELIFVDGFNHYNKELHTKVHYDPLIDVFKDSGIEIAYNDTYFSQIGDTVFVHPLTYSSGLLKTAERAFRYFRDNGFKDVNAVVLAHTHKCGHYDIGDGAVVYEQGCCCESSKMQYAEGKLTTSQREGFIIVYQDKDGKLIESKTHIVRLN